MPKEYIEVYQAGVTGFIWDFRELEIYSSGKPSRKKLLSQNKGQAEMVGRFLARIRDGGKPLIDHDEIFSTMRVTFNIEESIKTHQMIGLS